MTGRRMTRVLLTLTLVLLMAGLTARAWAYEQASRIEGPPVVVKRQLLVGHGSDVFLSLVDGGDAIDNTIAVANHERKLGAIETVHVASFSLTPGLLHDRFSGRKPEVVNLFALAWSFEQARAGTLERVVSSEPVPRLAAPGFGAIPQRRPRADRESSTSGTSPVDGAPGAAVHFRSVSVSTPSVRVPTALTLAQASVPSAAPHGEQTTLTGSSSRTANWPTPEAMRWQPPRGFLRAAFCVHRHESLDWYRAYVDWRGRPSIYSGGLQFTLSTWQRAGGSGHPHEWRPREQVYRAWRIWRRNGGSWREWGTAWKCGLA